MAINVNKWNRVRLSKQEKEFLTTIIPWARTISDWTTEKAIFKRLYQYTCTLNPCVVLADILVSSQWGNHELSQPYYNKRYSNNLSLIKKDGLWEGKIHKYIDGNEYKTYSDWGAYAADYSDVVVFSSLREILKTQDIEMQINILSKTKDSPQLFAAKASTLIDFYSLTDFN